MMKGRNGQFIKVLYLTGKMEETKKNQTRLKAVGAFVVITGVFCALWGIYDWFVWGLSILAVITVIVLLIRCIKKYKELEWELYSQSKKDLEDQKKLAEMRGEYLPDAYENYRVREPERELHFPILYVVFLIVFEVMIGFLIK